jgi:hypothetical protein
VVLLGAGMTGCSDSTTPEASPPASDDGYDLIVLAGQSNMQGLGMPLDPKAQTDPRVWQYAASGPHANSIIAATDPLAMPGVVGIGVGPGIAFGRAYADSVPPNRRVLLVPVAVGGEPLVPTVPPSWNSSVPGSLYSQMITLTQGALAAAGPGARLAAFLWIQGEADGAQKASGVRYQSAFDALVGKMRTDLYTPDLPVVVGQMLPDLLPFPERTRTEINAVQAVVGSHLYRAAFAPGPFGYPQDLVGHYSAAGIRILARSMFDAYRRINDGTRDPSLPAPPAQPTGVTTSDSVSTKYTLSWAPVEGAGSYFIDHSATADGAYSVAATTTETTTTVPRLSPDGTEYVRVRAVNVAGGGAPATATVVGAAPP